MSEDVQARILAAATHLFANRGYGSTSVREVVEAASVTKPTLYYWFQSKEQLYRTCVRACFDALVPLVHDAVNGPGTIEERLERFVQAYVDGGIADTDRMRLALTATSPTWEARPEIDLMSFHQEYVEPLAQLFLEGRKTGVLRPEMDPQFAVVGLVGLANITLKCALVGIPLPEDFAKRTVDLYLNGVGTQ